MSSALAQQLQAINISLGRPNVGRQRGRPSLLLDRYQAADLDVTELLLEAEAGTIYLVNFNMEFLPLLLYCNTLRLVFT